MTAHCSAPAWRRCYDRAEFCEQSRDQATREALPSTQTLEIFRLVGRTWQLVEVHSGDASPRLLDPERASVDDAGTL